MHPTQIFTKTLKKLLSNVYDMAIVRGCKHNIYKQTLHMFNSVGTETLYHILPALLLGPWGWKSSEHIRKIQRSLQLSGVSDIMAH